MNISIKIKSWEDITINMYKEIMNLSKREELSEAERNIALIAMFCNVDEKDIWNLELGEVQELKESIKWIDNFNPRQDIKYKQISFGDYECDVRLDLTHMTLAQYVDFQAMWSMDNSVDNIANILKCFLVPKGKKYGEEYDMDDFVKSMENNLSFKTAQELYFFMYRSLVDLTKVTIKSLSRDLKKMRKKKEMKPVGEKIDQAMKEIERLTSTIGYL